MQSEEEAIVESKTGKRFPRFKDTSCQIENAIASLGRLLKNIKKSKKRKRKEITLKTLQLNYKLLGIKRTTLKAPREKRQII